MQVMSTAGAPFEMSMPFAGLHRLLLPLLPEFETLPQHHLDVLTVALGMNEGPAPDVFLVALSTMDLLTNRAAVAPLLIVVEDAHWLDAATVAVLTFIARRVEMEPIVVLVAARDDHDDQLDQAGLPELILGALDDPSASALLDAQAPSLAADERKRLLDESAGNPLALIEFARALDAPLASTVPTMVPLPIADRLERAFAARISTLPALTRSLLLVAASDEGGGLHETLSATSLVADRTAALEDFGPAEDAGLVTVSGNAVQFRQPLVRAAIYQSATLSERQAVHRALSEVHDADADRRVWHRASALTGPDQQVAGDLEAAAERALRRGAPGVAAAALARAAEISDPGVRGHLLLRAAELDFEVGRPHQALALLADANSLPLAASDRIRLSLMLEASNQDSWSGPARIAGFVEIASRTTIPAGSEHALNSLLSVAIGCWWGNPDQETRDLVVATAKRVSSSEDDPRLLAILANADPVGQSARLIARISKITPDPAEDPATLHLLGSAASAVWAFDLALGFLTNAVDGLRLQGRLGLLAQALVAQSWAAVHLARETMAVSAADEGARLARETGQPRWALAAELAKVTVAGERGDSEAVEEVARRAEGELLPVGAQAMLSMVQFARGRCAVAHQLYPEGFECLKRILDPSDVAHHPFVGSWALSDLVEAAAYSGRPEEAEAYLSQLESLATKTSGPFLKATLAYARPLLAADDQAEQLYLRALDSDLSNWPCYRGRLLLNYGRWLRHQRRIAESRGPLRAARENFDALAFGGLSDSARRELRASGEVSTGRAVDARDQLTPQELQIAQLAAAGMSNREIGQKLYLSHRTVGSHLYRIFPKLGIASRAELTGVLPGNSPTSG